MGEVILCMTIGTVLGVLARLALSHFLPKNHDKHGASDLKGI